MDRFKRFMEWAKRRAHEPSHAYLFVGALTLASAAGIGYAYGWFGVLGAMIFGALSGSLIGQLVERED
jgi:hypothetical protein